jgi:Fe-Mn family superoxide dismutase
MIRVFPIKLAEPDMNNDTRREFLRTSAAMGVSLAAGASATAAEPQPSTSHQAYGYQHTPVPLPFDAKNLKGLSEKLIQSHWENNYGGAVRALNTLRGRLAAAAADANMPPFVYTGMKREQLLRTGSVVLHELYFAGLGGNGQAGSAMRSRIAASFGSYDAWEVEFRKIAMGLAGGSGWVMLGYNEALGSSKITGWRTMPPRQRILGRCWSSTCTSTRSTWTTVPPRRATSMHGSRT